jgi:hypothetical protein
MASAASGGAWAVGDRRSSGAAAAAEAQGATAAASVRLGPFARAGERDQHAFSHALGFLAPQDLGRTERVCRLWNGFVGRTDQWKRYCQRILNIGPMDPARFLPEDISYKEAARRGLPRTKIYDGSSYQRILRGRGILRVDIGPVPPPIPETISLARSNQPDPCGRMPGPRDQAGTIGQNYVWMWSPHYFEIQVNEDDFPYELREVGDHPPEDAPRLVRKRAGPAERAARTIRLRIPNTIYNLGVLFRHLNKAEYLYMCKPISTQHGDKRISDGWVCMREEVVARNRTFAQQEADVAIRDGVIVQLGCRILFNFLRHAETGIYPEGDKPWMFARTSTRTADGTGRELPSSCGEGGIRGLRVDLVDVIDDDRIGVAVALPSEA